MDSLAPWWRAGGGGCGQPGSLLDSMERRVWTAWLLGGEHEEEVVDSLAPCWRAGGGGCGQPGSSLVIMWRRVAGGGGGCLLGPELR